MRQGKEFSKLVVSAIVILNGLFTVAALYVFLKVGSEPVALIGAWFAFTTGELWLLASIKKKKIREGETNDQLETEINE